MFHIIKAILSIIVFSGLYSCAQAPGNSGGGTSGGGTGTELTGTITVSDTNYWEKIKIGIFSNTNPTNNYNTGYQTWSFATNLYYYYSSDVSYKSSVPVVSGSITGDATNFTRSFTVQMPASVKGLYYFLCTWYDADGNNAWECTNQDLNFYGNPNSEYIQLPLMDIVSSGNAYPGSVVTYLQYYDFGGLAPLDFYYHAYHIVSNMNLIEPIDNSLQGKFQFFIRKTNY